MKVERRPRLDHLRKEGAVMPTGKELVRGIEENFRKVTLPELKKNEDWRRRSLSSMIDNPRRY